MLKTAIAGAMLLLATFGAQAAEHEVKLLNKGAAGAMVFEPSFVKAAVGDTVTFVATDKGHNVEAIADMLPAGVETFKSKMGEDFVLTLTAEGLYGVKCTPHFMMGMVGLIQAGAPVNQDAVTAVELKGKAKTRFEPLLAQIVK